MIVNRVNEMPKEAKTEAVAFFSDIVATIDRRCDEHAAKGEIIYIHSIVSALVSALAHFLAGIADDDERKLAFGTVGIVLLDQMIRNREDGMHAHIEETTLQ